MIADPSEKGTGPFSADRRRKWTCPLFALLALAVAAARADELPDLFSEEFEHFAELTESPVDEFRLAGVQGFCWLKHFSAEPYLLQLAADPSPEVRREVAFALGRLGRRDSIPILLQMLADRDWGIAQHARLSLQRMTQFEDPSPEWWQSTSAEAQEQSLLQQLQSPEPAGRVRALKGLRCLAGPSAEAPLLQFLTAAEPPPDGYQQTLAAAVLECIGTESSLPWLDAAAQGIPAAAWALGQIGGPRAEEGLLTGLRRFGVWDPQHLINLDRLHSTRCGEFAPLLVGAYGCITYRGQPENLTYDPTPLQRACTNLILRSGRGPEVVDLVLREMEGRGVDGEIPDDLRPAMVQLREELKPGFVRNDGVTTSQPMSAMSHLIRDRRLAPRLVPLLEHPAFVARVYAAMALGRLGAVEALPAMVAAIEEGYPFADPMNLVSGKHFDYSQTVRWRGFLCMALGRMGGEEARRQLEQLACDASQYRDIRYGAVVGLGFIGAPESLPVLQQVAEQDIVWKTRVEAREIIHRIELTQADRQRGNS